MTTRIAAILVLLAVSLSGARASDEADVRAALDHYLTGHATGDPSHMRKAFLPTAHIEGLRDGKFVSWTLDEYLEFALAGGYAGAWPWSFSGTDEYGRLPAEPLKRFAERHPELVNPRGR